MLNKNWHMFEKQKQQNTEVDVKNEGMEELRMKCEEYLNGWKRATADYQNLKKEIETQRLEFAEYANVKALLHFIPVYDNLKKAFASVPDDQKKLGWVQGISYINRQLEEIFRQYGLEPIVTEGAPFNPESHEAVSEEHQAGATPGAIIKEVSAGYRMKGKVIMPAKVVVAK